MTENKVVLDGISFVASGRDYFYNAQRRLYLHRYVWSQKNGEIPKGYEIHHIDGNPRNNNISNLQMIEGKEHRKLHNDLMTNEERNRKRDNMLKNAHPKAKEWHKSNEGKEWHKEHYESMKDKLHAKVIIKCTQCDKECEVLNTGANKFCSNACKSAYRRKMGYDNVNRICKYCNKEFTCNKYKKTNTCSRSCSSKLRVNNKR